jgi:hypothetical protein
MSSRHIAVQKSRIGDGGFTCGFRLDTLPPDLRNEQVMIKLFSPLLSIQVSSASRFGRDA